MNSTKTRIGATITTAAVLTILGMGVTTTAQGATAPLPVSGTCVATIDSNHLLEVTGTFTAGSSVDPGTLSVAFQVVGDQGPLDSFAGHSAGTFSESTSAGASSAVAGTTVIDLNASWKSDGQPQDNIKIEKSCTVIAKSVVTPTPTPTPAPPVVNAPKAVKTGAENPNPQWVQEQNTVGFMSVFSFAGVVALIVGLVYRRRRHAAAK